MNKFETMAIDWLLLNDQRYSNYENEVYSVESLHEDSLNSTHVNNLDENN